MSFLDIYIDPEIRWSSYYRRSNKSKDKKHILCFPDHLISGHRNTGYCGRPIKVYINSYLSVPTLIICSRIYEYNGSKTGLNIDDLIPKSQFEDRDIPFYFGVSVIDGKEYIINDKLQSWKFNTYLQRVGPLYCLVIYGLILCDNQHYYKVMCKTISPLFHIYSSRRSFSGLNCTNENLNMEVYKNTPIPQYLKIKLSETDSLILSPLLIKNFPFLRYKNATKQMKLYDSLPEILLRLSNDCNNNDDPNAIIKTENNPYPFPDSAQIIKYVESFNDFREYMMDILNSEPVVTQYVYSQYGYNVKLRKLGLTKTSKEREEISYLGGSMNQMYERATKGIYYLDRYGNKIMCHPPDILREYYVNQNLSNE